MRLALKIILGLVIFLLVAVAAAAIILPQVVDPNDYKPLIVEEVKKATGRELTLGGDIELSVFPWLGAELNQVSLSSAESFGPEDMVSLDSAQVRVKVLPLLSKEVEVSTIVLDKPVIRLGVAKDGTTAWDDILAKLESGAKEPAQEEQQESAGDPPVKSVTIGGIAIRDGLLEWDDRSQGTKYTIRELNVETGTLSPGSPVDLSASCALNATEPAFDGRIALDATVEAAADNQAFSAKDAALVLTINQLTQADGSKLSGEVATKLTAMADLTKSLATLDGFEVRADLKGPSLPGGAAEAVLTVPSAEVAWEAGTASLPALTFSALDLKAAGSLKATGLNATPNITAALKLEPFSPRELLKAMGQDIPTQDASALSSAAADIQLTASDTALNVSQLTAKLDDSTLKGTLGVKNFATPAINFDLNIDTLNADRYMPPEGAEGQEPAPAESKPSSEQPQAGGGNPYEGLAVNGKARIGQFQLMKLKMQDVSLTLAGKDGVFNVTPLTANLYGGNATINAKATLGQEVGPSDMKLDLNTVSVGPLLEDFLGGFGWIGGTTSMNLNAATQGGADPTTTLSGLGDVNIQHGVLYGFTLVPGAVSGLLGGGSEALSKANETKFDELGANFAINSGQMDFKKLFLVRENGERIESEGAKVDLVGERLNIPMTMLADKLPAVKGVELDKLPLALTGSFDNPTLGVDPKALQEVIAAQIKDKATGKVKDAIGGAVGDKLPIPGLGGSGESGAKEGVGDTLKKGLGGFLGGGKQ